MTDPRRLTEQDIKEAFPDALPVINEKIREWEEKRNVLISEVREAIERGKGYPPLTREVCLELCKLVLNPRLAEIEHHLWRLRVQKEIYQGVARRDKITPDMISRAKDFPIESLADREVRRFGKLERMLCPFHQEKTPSLIVYLNNSWFCFGSCARGGDAIDFVRLQRGLTFQDAVRFLAGRTA